MAGKIAHKQNKFIQLLSLSILVLGLGTSALLVQQKMYNSKAATAPAPYPVCPSGQYWCGSQCGRPAQCTATGSLNCTQWLTQYCASRGQTPQPTARPATPAPVSSCAGKPVGSKQCSGNYLQTCLSSGYWSNTQLCSVSCLQTSPTSAQCTTVPTPTSTTTQPKYTVVKNCTTAGVNRCSNGSVQECSISKTEYENGDITEIWQWATVTNGTMNGLTAGLKCGTGCTNSCYPYSTMPTTMDGTKTCLCAVTSAQDECSTLKELRCDAMGPYDGKLYSCSTRTVQTTNGNVTQKFWSYIPSYTCGRLACPVPGAFGNSGNMKTREGLPACPRP